MDGVKRQMNKELTLEVIEAEKQMLFEQTRIWQKNYDEKKRKVEEE